MERDALIIVCKGCGVSNRIKSYSEDRLPVCAKCRHPLIDKDENEAHARYTQKLKDFYNLPDINDLK
ncbi:MULTISPECIES: hypothetical protein [unclassified Nitrospina]|uniref:hypothetical protein n=1 Tax=unclassified Nitrospina TaxID=2638683 RepID=UPI003F9BA5B7